MKHKVRDCKYDEERIKQLREDNSNEDKVIKRLEKKLGIRKRPRALKSKSKCPLWMCQYGLDYLVNFEEECQAPDQKVASVFPKTSYRREKLKPAADIYGQGNLLVGSKKDGKKMRRANNDGLVKTDGNLVSDEIAGVTIAAPPNDLTTDNPTDGGQQTLDFHRLIRGCLNRLSEAHMPVIISELTSLFVKYPRASVRSAITKELLALLITTPVNNQSSNIGWLQQLLAACLACLHINLQMQLQHDHIIGYTVETVIQAIYSAGSDTCLSSLLIFIAYLFRFGVLSALLVFDLLRELLAASELYKVRACHSICIAVGVHLRKANLPSCQEIIKLATTKLTELSPQQFELSCELEGIVRRLSIKHSKDECVRISMHLRKMIQIWTKVPSLSDECCLYATLQDLRDTGTHSRPWLVGSATLPPTSAGDSGTSSLAAHKESVEISEGPASTVLSPEFATAASRLGLRTPARQQIFSVLVSTPGGPEATATALVQACAATQGGASSSREREIVQLVLHCAMAEHPFNRFYPRVLGSLLNCSRRFAMMTKCAFWDTWRNQGLTVEAKENAGKTLGLLVLVFDLPLTLLKNFDFGDQSEGNVAFLKHTFIELITGDYQKVLAKFMQLSSYTRLGRNVRIFMRKHFENEPDESRKACVSLLIKDMRDSETF